MSQSYIDKINNFEVPPPTGSWDFIDRELLQDKGLLQLSKRLREYEVPPPGSFWNKIVVSLADEQPLSPRVIAPFLLRRSVSYIFIVAAIFGTILAGVLYIRNAHEDSRTSMMAANSRVINPFAMKRPIASSPMNVNEPNRQVTSIEHSSATHKLHPTYVKPGKVLHNTKINSSLIYQNVAGIMIAAKPIRNEKGEIIQNQPGLKDTNLKYISITGPNGQQTKISSKFVNLLLFINDDNDIEDVDSYFDKSFLESLIWKSRFRDWRNEIINTSLVPVSTNFMDILDFKDFIMRDM